MTLRNYFNESNRVLTRPFPGLLEHKCEVSFSKRLKSASTHSWLPWHPFMAGL